MSETNTDKPDVIQGRLGWESGDTSEATPAELEPHPKNRAIYGDTDDADNLDTAFRESVQEKGVLEPVVVTNGKQIISGHRRWLAAKDAGLEAIPIRYAEFDSELAEREALVEFNRQREKTPGQVVNEFEEILAIEKERAKERQKDAGSVGGSKGSETFHNPSEGRATEKAAEKVNADVSGRTLEKGLEVKEKAEQGDETAKEQWEKLKGGDTSFHQAKKTVEKADAKKKVEQERETKSTEPPVVKESDAGDLLDGVEDVDLLLTDPPYTTDVDDIQAFAESWVPKAVDTIGDAGVAFIFIGSYTDELRAYMNVLDECGVADRTQVLVWTYRNTLGQSPKDEYKRNWQAVLFIQSDPPVELDAPLTTEKWAVQDINAPDGRHDGRHHKWEKPTEIVERFIRHTTDGGDLIVDPFAGTGTTAIVANELGREVIAGDNSPEMLEIAKRRGCVIE